MSDGGSVVVGCDGTQATIQDVDPAPGYMVSSQTQGPTAMVKVVFTRASTNYTVRAHCYSGVVTATITKTQGAPA
jgi:hypothetical protein